MQLTTALSSNRGNPKQTGLGLPVHHSRQEQVSRQQRRFAALTNRPAHTGCCHQKGNYFRLLKTSGEFLLYS